MERTLCITIDGNEFFFMENSKLNVEAGGYEIHLIENGFDESTSRIEHGRFVNKAIKLPREIEMHVRRTSLLPCSGIYIDANGKRKFSAYFD